MRVLAGLGAYLAILLLLWASALAADETYRLVTPRDHLAVRAYQPWGLYHVVDWGRGGSTPEPQLIEHSFYLGRFSGPLECRRFARSMATRAVVDRASYEAITAIALPDVGWVVLDDDRWTRTRLTCRRLGDGTR